MSDHPIILGTITSSIKTKPTEQTAVIMSRTRRNENQREIENFLISAKEKLIQIDPYIHIPIQRANPPPDLDYSEEWEKMREEENLFFQRRNTNRSDSLNALLLYGKPDEDTFDKIG